MSPGDEVANGILLQSPRICQLHVCDPLCMAKGLNPRMSCAGQGSKDSYLREWNWPFEAGQGFMAKSCGYYVICASWYVSNSFSLSVGLQ